MLFYATYFLSVFYDNSHAERQSTMPLRIYHLYYFCLGLCVNINDNL